MAIRIDKLSSGVQKAVAKASQETNLEQTVSRELQMVPKYLECAKAKAGDLYRFNTKQVDEITSACSSYKTEQSVTDVVKDLLSIGAEGKAKQLSADEIVGFLKATSGMKQNEQKNVMRFLNAAKEDVPPKITPEYLKKEYPYDRFKETAIKLEYQHPEKLNPVYIEEGFLKNRYEGFIISQERLLTNQYYAAVTNPQKYPVADCITKNNKEVVAKIARCNEPEALYNVLKIAGTKSNALEASEDLVKLYTLSHGNKFLIKDVSKSFFATEIKDIADAIGKEYPKNKRMLERYFPVSLFDENPSIDWTRPAIVDLLGVKDKVKLGKLQYRIIDDVYRDNIAGIRRGSRIVGGNYERGKR